MLQSKLSVRQDARVSQPVERFRRRAWMPRYRHRLSIEREREVPRGSREEPVDERLPGEFIEPPEPTLFNTLKRGVGLASDISLLLLFSPFFAIWFLYRGVLYLGRSNGKRDLNRRTSQPSRAFSVRK